MSIFQNNTPLVFRIASRLLPSDSHFTRMIWKLMNCRFAKKRIVKSIAWDPWLSSDGERYWMFYLTDDPRESPHEWWTKGEIALAVSSDLDTWEIVGPILRPDPDNPWESKRMCAGCAIVEDGTQYLFYSAAGANDALDEAIGLAISTDGVHWRRHEGNPIIGIDADNPWYGLSLREGQIHAQCRDPYIVKSGDDGKYYMFFATALKTESPMEYSGCVGVAVSTKIEGPYDLLPPVTGYAPGLDETFSHEMERPQVLFRAGRYHLFWSAFSFLLNKRWKIKGDVDDHSKTFHFVSNNLLGPYFPHPTNPLVGNPPGVLLHGKNLFPVPGRSESHFLYGWDYTTKKIVVNKSNLFRWRYDR